MILSPDRTASTRRKRQRGPSFNQLIPNILTTLALCGGLIGIRFALNGSYKEACIALLISACLDGLDGRIARLLRATTQFGAEYDSLSDFVCFGVAPGLLIFLWAFETRARFAFIPCTMYTVCMALRLARFNSMLTSHTKPEYANNFFTGVPAPAGAGLALFPVFLGLEADHLHLEWLVDLAQNPWLCTFSLLGTSLLVVSTLPVWSFKNFRISQPYIVPILLGVGLYTVFLVADPWGALTVACVVYLALLPFSYKSYLRAQKAYRAFRERNLPLPAGEAD